MWRVLASPADFVEWSEAFMPSVFQQGGGRILSVPTVSDRSDARICHLDGLLLSKAWALRSCSGVLGRAGVGTNLTDAWCASADEHYAGMSLHIFSYELTHLFRPMISNIRRIWDVLTVWRYSHAVFIVLRAAASWMASDYVGSHWLHSFALLCLDHTERTD